MTQIRPSLDIAQEGAAVGASGKIATSPDAVTWTQRTSGTSGSLISIGWSGAVWVAGNNGGASAATTVSTDGVTWTVQAGQPWVNGSAGYIIPGPAL